MPRVRKKRKGRKSRKRGLRQVQDTLPPPPILTPLLNMDPEGVVWVSVDVETTGLSFSDQMIELCACVEGGKEFRRHFLPSVPISPAASRVHNLLLTTTENGERQLCHRLTQTPIPTVPLEEGMKDFVYFLSQLGHDFQTIVMVAHNASFDGRFIRPSLNKFKLLDTLIFDKVYLGCTLYASRRLYPEIKGPGTHKQGALYERLFGTSFENAHSASGDAAALLRIVQHWSKQDKEKLLTKLNLKFFRDM